MIIRGYILLIFFLIVIFFFKQIFLGEVFYCCDNLAINVPSKIFLIEELRQGRFPLWNPYILSGSAFLADINLGLLYPLNLLFFFFKPFRALTVGIFLDFIIAFTGIWILMKSLKVSAFGSAISSIIFTFSGTMVTYTNNVPMLQVASLLPWVMWAWMNFFNKPSRVIFLILVLLLTAQIIAGHPQLTFYTWLLGIAYLFVSPIPWKKRLIFLLGIGGMVFLLSSLQMVPFVQLAAHSTRVGRGFDYVSFDSLHPFNLLRLLMPNLVGNLSKGTDWLQGGSVYGYVGILPLLLLFFISFKNNYVKFFLSVAIISLILAFGKYTPLFYLTYKLIPGIGSFRSPQHFLLLYTFAISILSGFGVEAAVEKHDKKKFYRWLWVGGIFGVITSVILSIPSIHFVIPISKFSTLTSLAQKIIVQMILDNMMLGGMMLILIALITTFFNKNFFIKAVLLLAVFSELFLFARHGLVSINEKEVTTWFKKGNEVAEAMQETGNYRIFISPKLYANPIKKQFGIDYMAQEAKWQISILRTNVNVLYHLQTIDGYASLIDRSYKEFFQKGEGDPTGIDFGDLSDIPWNQFNVRYILASRRETVFSKNPQFVPIWSDDYKILYKNLHEFSSYYQNYFSPNSIIIGATMSLLGLALYGAIWIFGPRLKQKFQILVQ